MDRGARQATVHGIKIELDRTEWLRLSFTDIIGLISKIFAIASLIVFGIFVCLFWFPSFSPFCFFPRVYFRFWKYFIHLFLAVLSLHCCVGFSLVPALQLPLAVASLMLCRLWGLWASLVATHGLWLSGSRAETQQLWSTDLVASRCVGSSQTRDRTHISCIDGQSLIHRATMEALCYCIWN